MTQCVSCLYSQFTDCPGPTCFAPRPTSNQGNLILLLARLLRADRWRTAGALLSAGAATLALV